MIGFIFETMFWLITNIILLDIFDDAISIEGKIIITILLVVITPRLDSGEE